MFRLKIGIPFYLNTLPLLFYLPKNNVNFEILLEIPKKLNLSLARGEIHGSLSSSVVYARDFNKYLLLPDISISAVGEVKSVILCHKEPLEKLNAKKIGITPETESSFNLLRILMEDFINIKPDYIYLSTNWNNLKKEEKKELAGYLAIGDEALTLQLNNQEMFITDLAELWLKYTHLPFIFALFIIREEIAEKYKRLLRDFCLNIYYARACAFSNLEKIVEKSYLKFPKEFVYNYLTHLEYDFSGLKQKAFLTFCGYLYKKKIIPSIPELKFFEV
ncbi:menaquinone biosynthetic enzyme MqnA/MqnD family protein [Thermodesulfobacterium hydrogeniphilum]|uniref:menaquinone biosynthetic enzyme MqnA/MqnD family protein n=1 Tax=Thermodesulfobacterium hydrogeniphilum TaxID=161156 RepID=UPI00056ED0D0|nr:menaquinone biosynthesis protein [Thermodesulfobacterium hydrogeniphilum]